MHHGSVVQDSPIRHVGEEMEMTKVEMEEEVEEEAEETCHPLLEGIQKSEVTGQS